MQSLKNIYRIGYGPSSSHTMGPYKASQQFKDKYNNAASYKVTLYGSLAATGKGHLTDITIEKTLAPLKVDIILKPDQLLSKHTNGMKFEAFDENNNLLGEWIVYSTGGGEIDDYLSSEKNKDIYELTTMTDILNWTKKNGKSFWEYALFVEGEPVFQYLKEVWQAMQKSIERGIDNEGAIPGGLNIQRKAYSYNVKAKNYSGSLRSKTLLFSYALGAAEENACGGQIVTAPTCGSCGVLPAVLKYLQDSYKFSDNRIIRALATAGIVGNLVKKNASISGAKVGCQGEIGTACAMASAAATQLLGGTTLQIEYAAEMGIEHHLGLTCDPIAGLVQVPCIERNAFAAERALNSATFSLLSDGRHLVSFDKIVHIMNQTGNDLPHIYKETSQGGLALYGL